MNAFVPHILIVDDDARLRDLLQRFLRQNGFWATAAGDAAQARRIQRGLKFDLIVMDVMMPGEDGLAFTRALRQSNDTPILFLTALGTTQERITGLDAGGDDYLIKPFDPRELLLRIGAILRRRPQTREPTPSPRFLFLGAHRYDADNGQMFHNNEVMHLTATEQQLMQVFAAHANEILSRDRLVQELASTGAQAQERAVDVQIARLRRKFEGNPRKPRYLRTVQGKGYVLRPD